MNRIQDTSFLWFNSKALKSVDYNQTKVLKQIKVMNSFHQSIMVEKMKFLQYEKWRSFNRFERYRMFLFRGKKGLPIQLNYIWWIFNLRSRAQIIIYSTCRSYVNLIEYKHFIWMAQNYRGNKYLNLPNWKFLQRGCKIERKNRWTYPCENDNDRLEIVWNLLKIAWKSLGNRLKIDW